MDVRRGLLPGLVDGEEAHPDASAVEAAAGAVADEARCDVAGVPSPGAGEEVDTADGLESPRRQISTASSECLAAGASLATGSSPVRAGEQVDTADGQESPRRQISTEGAMNSGYEEDFFFDLGTGFDTGSEDGGNFFDFGTGDDTGSEDGGNPSNPSSPAKGANFSDDELNDGEEGDSGTYEKPMFRNIADVGDWNTSLDEFWDIANKTFVSEQEAFLFYNKYAMDKGFGVRKEKVRHAKPSGAILFRHFLCAREGERHGKWLNKKDYSRRPRALTRCDCPALLDIRLDRSRGVWFVHNLVDEHNHRLASPNEVPFLWSHRKMKDFLKHEIMSMEAAGIRKHVIRDVLQCRYGEKVGIVTKDVYNYSSRHKRSRIMDGDAKTVLGLMLRRQRIDPDFYFDYQVDEDGRLMSMFWCDSQSCMDYQSFGDVVIFDSTYRMNRYKMPFIPFVGLNHHRSTTVFGCGIVADERAEIYVWLLRAFLKAMCQQKPKSIITDGDGSMIKAIRQVLPGINHRVCCWHVEKNVL